MTAHLGRRFHPRIETLEDRCQPATFKVTNLLDDGSAGSLRKRIEAANTAPGLDTIVFKPGLEGTIKLDGNQITIKDDLVLNGPGAAKVTIDGNAASRIFNVDDGTGAVKKVTISGLALFNGRIAGDGGAIFSREDLVLKKTILVGNVATGSGGAIESQAGKLTVQQSRLIGNRSEFGGAIDCDGNTSLLIVKSAIFGNHADSSGGAIWSDTSTTIRGSTISGNNASVGGGIRLIGGSLTIEASTITGNRSGTAGGGISSSSGDLIIRRSTVSANQSESDGGGISLTGGSLTIEASTITGNRSGTAGGGISSSAGNLIIRRSTVSANQAGSDGGGIEHDSGSLTIEASAVTGNTAAGKGGGIYLQNCNDATLRNSTLSGNFAGSYGGGVYQADGKSTVNNCTIAFNRATLSGAGISSTGGEVNLESTIVALNIAGTVNPDLDSGTTTYRAAFCLIGDINVAGFGNFTSLGNNIFGKDPLLAPLAKNGGPTETHALKKGSPVINKGSNPDTLKTDQRGGPFKRKLGSAVDIGAFERQ